jgi:methylated-DNA-[protein]-cysteine S-methyltransferase
MEVKTCFLSKFGCIEITGNEVGIVSLRITDRSPCPAGPIPKSLKKAVVQLTEYFRGNLQKFDLPLDISGHPPFHQAVWTELLKIPYGKTTTYQAISKNLGDPLAVRAVGQANSKNPIAIVIPCHRCIAKSGELQGYFYGLDLKRKLLALENPQSYGEQTSLF